jgi:hypothetical protein
MDLKIVRYSGWMGFLLLALLVSVCFAQSQDSTSANANQVANDTVDATSTVGADINGTTAKDGSSNAGVQASVQGIWKVSLGENVITAAFNQSGESIFGPAKFEGDDPWNGAVAGSLSGNAISLSLAAVEGGTVASTYISGNVEGDSMKGYFIRSDGNGIATRGEFAATLISPDASGYTPAAIQTVSTTVAERQLISEESNATMPLPAAKETESKFKDVTQLAGIDPSILPRMASL